MFPPMAAGMYPTCWFRPTPSSQAYPQAFWPSCKGRGLVGNGLATLETWYDSSGETSTHQGMWLLRISSLARGVLACWYPTRSSRETQSGSGGLRLASRSSRRICWVSQGFREESPNAACAIDTALQPPWELVTDKKRFLVSRMKFCLKCFQPPVI